ncbi:glutathione S-transferase family protein [Allopontixanthobacter sp.]|uniref:glutathione S-transferase family protein n=1 Tax=Allopontixanthobacter sp. TaxID=2906452 RepID=UPI002ABBB86F|nr:glutathione S-transferase family protein [Allopontixanthobacter sp.]MDZ4308341.1 glutathione S-transferase family protein [Allopontixanthobacter sp.]
MTDYTFFTNPMSRGQIARWALHEAGADYDTVLVDWADKPQALLDANPLGKVPTLIHHHGGHDHVITECAAICAYLADIAAPNLAPTQEERADYYRGLFFGAGPLEQAIVAHAMGWQVPEGKEGMAGFGTYDRTVDTLEKLLTGRDYVCGARFTMADVYLGSQVDWGLQFKSLPERGAFKSYAERLRSRDAYNAAKSIDLGLIEQAKMAG